MRAMNLDGLHKTNAARRELFDGLHKTNAAHRELSAEDSTSSTVRLFLGSVGRYGLLATVNEIG
jgi:hypothetical protein